MEAGCWGWASAERSNRHVDPHLLHRHCAGTAQCTTSNPESNRVPLCGSIFYPVEHTLTRFHHDHNYFNPTSTRLLPRERPRPHPHCTHTITTPLHPSDPTPSLCAPNCSRKIFSQKPQLPRTWFKFTSRVMVLKGVVYAAFTSALQGRRNSVERAELEQSHGEVKNPTAFHLCSNRQQHQQSPLRVRRSNLSTFKFSTHQHHTPNRYRSTHLPSQQSRHLFMFSPQTQPSLAFSKTLQLYGPQCERVSLCAKQSRTPKSPSSLTSTLVTTNPHLSSTF